MDRQAAPLKEDSRVHCAIFALDIALWLCQNIELISRLEKPRL